MSHVSEMIDPSPDVDAMINEVLAITERTRVKPISRYEMLAAFGHICGVIVSHLPVEDRNTYKEVIIKNMTVYLAPTDMPEGGRVQ